MKSCVVALLLCMAIGRAQTREAEPKFEVASIRLSDCDFSKVAGRGPSIGRINLKCAHLRDVIQRAHGYYRFNPLRDQVAGGPGWLDSDFYDIAAKAEGDASTAQMTGPAMQALLEDRFRLKIHREAKEVAVYELTVGKSGPKLQVAREGSCIALDPEHPPGQQVPGQAPLRVCEDTRLRTVLMCSARRWQTCVRRFPSKWIAMLSIGPEFRETRHSSGDQFR